MRSKMSFSFKNWREGIKIKPVLSLIIPLIIILVLSVVPLLSAQQTGKVIGKVVDSETGEALIGANVYFEGASIGAATDLDGTFLIPSVPPGEYTLVVQMISYATLKINNLKVEAGKTNRLEITLKPEALTTEEVVVEARMVQNNEASLLKARQKSAAVSDAVSAETFSRAGSGNAAEAMKQVTGASVVEGKYVFVRGLGDRYTSTQLNGAEIPSTNPYKRAGAIDLIPTNLVANITTIKSFTPDKPGDFSGGAVDINTKDYPDKFNLTISTSTSYNTQTSFNNNGPISYNGGDMDWLGMDDGTREIPEPLQSGDVFIPRADQARTNPELATKLDRLVNNFNPVMTPSQSTPPLNQSYSISIGDQLSLFKRPLGILASFSYSRNFSSYDDGTLKRWVLGSEDDPELINDFDLTDTKSTAEVLWGGLLKGSYKLANNHSLGLNFMYNQNGESTARYLEGPYPYDLSEGELWQTSVLSYNERTLSSLQLSGDHLFDGLFNTKISWRTSFGSTKQDEPDLRYFTSFLNNRDMPGIKRNVPPQRYYRFMDEDRKEAAIDLSIPFKQWSGLNGSLKFGAYFVEKDRSYNERLFEYSQNPVFRYNGNPEDLFSDENTGLIDTTTLNIGGNTYTTYNFGLVINESYLPANNYTGNQNINAYYAMVDIPIFSHLRFIGGARYETTDMVVETEDEDLDKGDLQTEDILPSANLIYNLYGDMNLRIAYGKTLARPSFREVAPYATFDFAGGDTYIGNPHLKRTLIDNFDVRWEWFSRPGEIYAISAFYKQFKDPIEVSILNVNHEIQWKNVDKAYVQGLEFEVRKRLDVISGSLRNFLVGGNLSLVESEVEIGENELELIRLTRPNAPDTREFAGQSPYILNLNLTYENMKHGMVASAYYNIFGERLSVVSLGGTPDVYEQPAGRLNLSFSWQFTEHFKIKLSGKNVLDEETRMIQKYNGKEFVYSLFQKGRSISLGLGYDF